MGFYEGRGSTHLRIDKIDKIAGHDEDVMVMVMVMVMDEEDEEDQNRDIPGCEGNRAAVNLRYKDNW